VKRTRRTYTDDERASALAALAANSGNVKLTARQLGIDPGTLRGWRKSPMAVDPALVVAATEKLDSLLERIAGKLATGLNRPEAIARVLGKPVQAATVLGILTDKLVALRKTAPDESTLTLSEFLALAKGVKGAGIEHDQLPTLASESTPERPN